MGRHGNDLCCWCDGRIAVTTVMLWSSNSSSFAGVFISTARLVCQQNRRSVGLSGLFETTGKPFVLISNPARRDGLVVNADGWMREEEGETLSGGCRTRQMSGPVVSRLQMFGRHVTRLQTSNTFAPQR